MKSSLLILFIFFIYGTGVWAGNIQVSNVTLVNQNTTSNTYDVQFDLTWENSWRTSTLESNWDAAWVVIKFRETPSALWDHATLSTSAAGIPAGVESNFAGATGVFLYRDSDGIGDFNATDIRLVWSYGSSIPDDAIVEVCVLAIEMVYIPQADFVVGDDSPNATANFQAGITTNPYSITSENSITLGGTSSSNLNTLNTSNFPQDDFNTSTTQSLPAAYPKGFDAFYIMKYEMSQGQYADFLNKIGSTGAANRYPGNFGSSGNNLAEDGATPEQYYSTTPDRPQNYLSWPDLAAYADWIGLRPMSELEYEKSCRGTRPAGADEFAWGNAFISNNVYVKSNDGQANESITNPGIGTGNAMYSVTDLTNNAPSRCGIFAFSAVNKTRAETGGSYYGVMELTGNLWEPVITTGNAEGRQFTGIHGNGIINSSGNSTVGTTWPSVISNPIADGTGLRGGSFARAANDITVSNRDLAVFDISSRFSDTGGRLVRTEP